MDVTGENEGKWRKIELRLDLLSQEVTSFLKLWELLFFVAAGLLTDKIGGRLAINLSFEPREKEIHHYRGMLLELGRNHHDL